MEKLTERQEKLYNYLKSYTTDTGYPPSVREMVSYFGFSSTSLVYRELENLKKKGYIKKDPTKPRAITVIEGMVQENNKNLIPFLSRFVPDWDAQKDVIKQYIPFPMNVSPEKNYFAVRMDGDALHEYGIFDQDIMYFESCDSAEDGSIVIASADGVTITGILAEGGIHTAGKSSKSITPANLIIHGKLAGISRVY